MTEMRKLVDARQASEGNFLKPEHVGKATGKIGIITSPGTYEKGKFGEKLVLGVQFDMLMKQWTVNQTSASSLVDGYGTDTTQWVGKKVEFSVGKSQAGQDMIVGVPVATDIVKTEKVV